MASAYISSGGGVLSRDGKDGGEAPGKGGNVGDIGEKGGESCI